jgi:hypothetical protein
MQIIKETKTIQIKTNISKTPLGTNNNHQKKAEVEYICTI